MGLKTEEKRNIDKGVRSRPELKKKGREENERTNGERERESSPPPKEKSMNAQPTQN